MTQWIGFLGDAYPWIRALHIISVIAWMAGLLYLPRLFVYHAEAAPGSDKSETFKVMERRLLRGIMNPAMIASLIFGLLLFVHGGLWAGSLDARQVCPAGAALLVPYGDGQMAPAVRGRSEHEEP